MTPAFQSLSHLWQQSIHPALASKIVLLSAGLNGLTSFVLADVLTDNKTVRRDPWT